MEYETAIILYGLGILFAIALGLLFINIITYEFVLKHSELFLEIEKLNSQYSFAKITKQVYLHIYCRTKNEFDRLEGYDYIWDTYRDRDDLFSKTYNDIEFNISEHKRYLIEYNKLNDIYALHYKNVILKQIEKLLCRFKKLSPCTDSNFIIRFTYQTPAGRYTYNKTYNYNHEQCKNYISPYLLEIELEEYRIKTENDEINENQLLTKNITPEKELIRIDRFSGIQFEKWCGNLLDVRGYKNITFTKTVGDYGADIICERDNKKYAVQCKCYSKKLGLKPIQEVIGAINYYKCDYGIVITNNYFTPNAKSLALKNSIELIDRKKLIDIIGMLYQGKTANNTVITIDIDSITKTNTPQKIKNSADNNLQGLTTKEKIKTYINNNNLIKKIRNEELELAEVLTIPQGEYIIGEDLPEGKFVVSKPLNNESNIAIKISSLDSKINDYYWLKNEKPECRLVLCNGKRISFNDTVNIRKAGKIEI